MAREYILTKIGYFRLIFVIIPTEPQGEQRNRLKVFGGLKVVEGVPRLATLARDDNSKKTHT